MLNHIYINFIYSFLDLLPEKKLLFIGDLCFHEYMKFLKKEMQDKGEKTVKLQESFKSLRENKFLIKSNNHNEFRKELELKPDFDFVFSDHLGLIRQMGPRASMVAKGGGEVEINGVIYVVNQGIKEILEQIKYVNENGFIAFYLEEAALVKTTLYPADKKDSGRTGLNIKLNDLLNDKGFYINAILGIKKPDSEYLNRNRRFGPDRKKSIFVFSKRKTESVFIADAGSTNFNYNNLFNFLYDHSLLDISSDIDLENGYLLNIRDFHTFSGIQARSRIEKFKSNYENYKVVKLGDLIIDISHGYAKDKITDKNSNYIQLLGNFYDDSDEIVTAEPTLLLSDRTSDNYLINLENEVYSKYVAIFLQSKLGHSLYESYLTAKTHLSSGYELSEKNLREIPIFIPNLDVQKQIIDANSKIIKLQDSIDLFSDGLSSNPNMFLGEDIQKIDNMLDEVGKLNDAEKIRSWIYGFESQAVEFKQTWRLPTQGEKKEEFIKASKRINAVVFKVINSFINSSGGSLVIGVSDEKHEIVGIEEELEHYYKKVDSIDKRVDKFDNAFKQSLNSAFASDFIRLIDFHPVFLDGKIVYLVSCSPGEKACFIQDSKLKDDLRGNSFFVREGANSVPKNDEDLVIYCTNHFPNAL
jgi:hypothetical protein